MRNEKLKLKDFKDAFYYMVTKELVPKEDTNRIERAVNIIGLSGLAAMVGGVLISCAISLGPKEAFRAFNYGVNCAASLEYGGNPKR